jgi:hypothetical protein
MAVFRLLSRSLGFVLLAAALAAIAIDAARSIAASAVTLTELGPAWSAVNAASLAAFRRMVVPNGGASLWDWIVTSILMLPLSVALTIAGFAFIFLGAPRPRAAPA